MRDLLLYVAIGVAVVAAVMTFTKLSIRYGWSPDSSANWLGFFGMTLVVFGDAIYRWRRKWRREFWVALLGGLAIQSGIASVALRHVSRVPAMVWGGLFMVNVVALESYLEAACRVLTKRRSQARGGRTRG